MPGNAQIDGRAGVILSGGVIRKAGTVSVDPPSAATQTTVEVVVTIQGAEVGDAVFLVPPNTLEAGLTLEGATVTANNQVTIAIRNSSGGTVDGAALNWKYLLIAL